MKKIFLVFFIFITFFINNTFAIENYKKVYKIQTYEFNSLENTFDFKWYWSAVLVWENKIITNAHVVLDENNKVLWNYEICKTIDFQKAPICFSIWKLLYYDIWNDLALLEIFNSNELEQVKFAEKKVDLWNDVSIYWYPSNGWDTITYTKGKISGFAEWLFKTDANLDFWNSWWWAFDSEKKLLWIPVAISVWESTLGMIIPIEKVKNFLGKKWRILYYNKKINLKFLNYFKSRNKFFWKNFIENKYFKLSNLDNFWFEMYDNYYDLEEKKFAYFLQNKNQNVFLTIKNNINLWRKLSFEEEKALFIFNYFVEKNWENINKNDIIFKSKKIDFKWKEVFSFIWFNKITKEILFKLKIWNIDFSIIWKKENIWEIKKAISLFIKNFKFKKTLENNQKNINFYWLKFNNVDELQIIKNISNYFTFNLLWLYKGSFIIISIVELDDNLVNSSYKKSLNILRQEYKKIIKDLKYFIIENKNWKILFYFHWKTKNFTYSNIFILFNKINWKNYVYTIWITSKNQSKLKKDDLLKIVDNIDFLWKNFYKIPKQKIISSKKILKNNRILNFFESLSSSEKENLDDLSLEELVELWVKNFNEKNFKKSIKYFSELEYEPSYKNFVKYINNYLFFSYLWEKNYKKAFLYHQRLLNNFEKNINTDLYKYYSGLISSDFINKQNHLEYFEYVKNSKNLKNKNLILWEIYFSEKIEKNYKDFVIKFHKKSILENKEKIYSYNQIWLMYERKHYYDLAIKNYENAYKLDKKNLLILRNLCLWNYMKVKELNLKKNRTLDEDKDVEKYNKKAIWYCKKFEKLYEDKVEKIYDYEVYKFIWHIYYLGLKDLKNWEKYYKKSLEINPNLDGALNNLALLYQKLAEKLNEEKYLLKSLELLKKAYEISPETELYKQNLYEINTKIWYFYYSENKNNQAIKYYEEYERISWKTSYILELLKQEKN